MPNVMVAMPIIGGALCSTLQSLADAPVAVSMDWMKVNGLSLNVSI